MLALAITAGISALLAPGDDHTAAAKTEAAVIAADESWSSAEQRGDARFLDWLLEPGYVSVGADGRVHDKAAIVASA